MILISYRGEDFLCDMLASLRIEILSGRTSSLHCRLLSATQAPRRCHRNDTMHCSWAECCFCEWGVDFGGQNKADVESRFGSRDHAKLEHIFGSKAMRICTTQCSLDDFLNLGC